MVSTTDLIAVLSFVIDVVVVIVSVTDLIAVINLSRLAVVEIVSEITLNAVLSFVMLSVKSILSVTDLMIVRRVVIDVVDVIVSVVVFIAPLSFWIESVMVKFSTIVLLIPRRIDPVEVIISETAFEVVFRMLVVVVTVPAKTVETKTFVKEVIGFIVSITTFTNVLDIESVAEIVSKINLVADLSVVMVDVIVRVPPEMTLPA